MRFMSVASLGLVVCLSSVGCGTDDKVLEPDGNTSGDGGGGANNATGGTNGATNGSTNSGNTGSSQGGNTSDDNTGGNVGGTPSDPDCDMNGIWIGNQVTRSQALGQGQFSNNWYYLELSQEGDDVTVTKHFDCGIEVRGSVTVIVSRASADALRSHNIQTGRKGTLKKDGTKCTFKMDRFWSIRGGDEAKFAPNPRNSTQSISEVAASNPIPTKDKPTGAEDWENDGKLGSAWQISGALQGTRNSVQRDWTEWFSETGYEITAATDFKTDLVVRANFDAEEQIFDATSPLLNQLSTTDASAKHTLTLRFLGRDKNDARVKALVKSDDFETCKAVQAALPVQSEL